MIRKVPKLVNKQLQYAYILTNISRGKGNQAMKLDQLTDYNKRYIFIQKLCGKENSLVPDLFLFLKRVR